MLNFLFISFAFSAGLAAFFAPCAATLLPGYIAYYVSQKDENISLRKKMVSASFFSLAAILGFFTLFGIFGSLVIFLGHKIKVFIPYVAVFFGVFLILLGISMLFGRNMMLNFHMKSRGKNAYSFGLAYGAASLGCTFPLFITVILQAIIDASFLNGFISLVAYILGLSILMFAVTLAAAFAQDLVQKYINNIMPYIRNAGAVIIIIAGIYMLYYQSLF